jgi:hypothetical protein
MWSTLLSNATSPRTHVYCTWHYYIPATCVLAFRICCLPCISLSKIDCVSLYASSDGINQASQGPAIRDVQGYKLMVSILVRSKYHFHQRNASHYNLSPLGRAMCMMNLVLLHVFA